MSVEIAFAGSPLPLVASSRLRECNNGELNGTAEPLRDRDAHADLRYPGGESRR